MAEISRVWNKVPETYKGIVLFLLCLFVSNFLWKLTIAGDQSEEGVVTFCGFDISCVFSDATFWFAEKTHRLLALLGVQTQLVMDKVSYANGNGSKIIAGCTAIKQFYMMTVILLFSRGKSVHKIWYWLLSIVVLVGYNILRLALLTYIVRDHREYFDFMHEHVMKYIFYGVMFLLWLMWDEWLRNKLSKKSEAD